MTCNLLHAKLHIFVFKANLLHRIDNLLAALLGANFWGCNSRLIMSHMRLRKTGPINICSWVRNTISCAFIPLSVGANSVRVRHETTNRVTA